MSMHLTVYAMGERNSENVGDPYFRRIPNSRQFRLYFVRTTDNSILFYVSVHITNSFIYRKHVM